MGFSEGDKIKVLLWCDRHCCLCKKSCGVNIEVHHLIPGDDDIDNGIPLCFDCHSEVGRYNADHPRGTKFKIRELKTRRDQIYEEFTRHLVPPIDYHITQQIPGGNLQRKFPDTGFVLTHMGDSWPVQIRVIVESFIDNNYELLPSDLYSGQKLWHLNPRFMISGHFHMPDQLIPKENNLELRVRLSIIDQYFREHLNLPISFIYNRDGDYWYLEP